MLFYFSSNKCSEMGIAIDGTVLMTDSVAAWQTRDWHVSYFSTTKVLRMLKYFSVLSGKFMFGHIHSSVWEAKLGKAIQFTVRCNKIEILQISRKDIIAIVGSGWRRQLTFPPTLQCQCWNKQTLLGTKINCTIKPKLCVINMNSGNSVKFNWKCCRSQKCCTATGTGPVFGSDRINVYR